MMPWRSTSVPIMNPGTSARNTRGRLKASHSHTNRATLSAESTNSTPPLCSGWLATTPTARPSIRPRPQTTSGANSRLISKKLPSSTTAPTSRSEEHTSELQSHSDLVCRLQLETKKPEKHSHLHERPQHASSNED